MATTKVQAESAWSKPPPRPDSAPRLVGYWCVLARRGSVLPSPFVVQVQYRVGERQGWATRVGVVPNCPGIRIRAGSPRHKRPVMDGEGGSCRYSQCSSHDRPRDQLLHRSPPRLGSLPLVRSSAEAADGNPPGRVRWRREGRGRCLLAQKTADWQTALAVKP